MNPVSELPVILPDHHITRLCEAGLVSPFDASLVNPASLDVRLGGTLLIESAAGPELVPYPLDRHDEAEPFWLRPGQFVLADTLEAFFMPDDVAGEFRLKSSRAREGLDQALAVWLDPGWCGSVLTMEIRNNRQLHPIPLWPGRRIGQIILHLMATPPERSYRETGRYNGDQTVAASKG